MRTPHVYQRSARPNASTPTPAAAGDAARLRQISVQLSKMVDEADVAGAEHLSDLLEAARQETERLIDENDRPHDMQETPPE